MKNIRPLSKVSIILQMISRPNGASVSEMMEATVSSSMRIRAMISDLRTRHIKIITRNENANVDHYHNILSTIYVRKDI